uniref:Uridylyltransferase-related family protein n=1 Tax=Rhizophora mucronata TaxID=61149 RepID=A0A2P2LRA8_RHIMU
MPKLLRVPPCFLVLLLCHSVSFATNLADCGLLRKWSHEHRRLQLWRCGISLFPLNGKRLFWFIELANLFYKQDGSHNGTDSTPTPKVIIDQDSNPDATVVEITFGDRLGALLDTV